jgi:hypothetical protein
MIEHERHLHESGEADSSRNRRFEPMHWSAVIAAGKNDEAAGKKDLYEALEPFVSCDIQAPAYSDPAKPLRRGESAVKIAVHRLRRDSGRLLREEVANTLTSPAQVEDELRYLFDSLQK